MGAARVASYEADASVMAPPVTAVVVCGLPILSTSLRHQLQPSVALTAVIPPDDNAKDVVRHRQAELCIIVAPVGPHLVRLIEQVVAAAPRTRVIVLSAQESSAAEVLSALAAGADGWLPLHIGPGQLVSALRGVAAGEAALPRRLMADVLEQMRGNTGRRVVGSDGSRVQLSRREHEVLSGLAEGLSTSEVAVRLGIGEATVRGYLSSAVRRTGAADRDEAVELLRQSA